jgi:predicted DNA binding protein
MMTKWDTIQADVSDAYRHLDELEAIDKHNNEVLFDEDTISLDELTEQELTLDWEGVE